MCKKLIERNKNVYHDDTANTAIAHVEKQARAKNKQQARKTSKKQGYPMTINNVKKYNLTEKQVQQFCDKGCSAICYEEFMKKFAKNK